MYQATIRVSGDPKTLTKLFHAEIQEHVRSSISLKEQKQGIAFIIKAQDATALRSTLHGITKLLQVYESLSQENDSKSRRTN